MSARNQGKGKMWPGLPGPTLIDDILRDLHRAFADERGGAPADYIPDLAKANPDHFGIAIVTADGASYTVGDWRVPFTIQSISKPFVFGLALEDHGRDAVLRKVGVEPSGDAFNSIIFDQRANRPFNPMVNAGAIATSALIRGPDAAGRLGRVLDMFGRYIGHPVDIDHAVFASEKATGHRNRAIAHLELNFGMIDAPVDDHLDVYFQQCSALVTCHDLAVMAATLANGGVNPLTGERAIAADHVKNVIAVMNSCGMYDYSGEWSYRIGLPAKSGVGGGIIAVLPGRLGIGVFSPPLDARGNSLRGIKVCEALSERFGLNMFDVALNPASAVRRRRSGAAVRSKRARTAAECAILDQQAGRIHVLELRGDVTFIALEQVTRAIAGLPPETDYLIVDLARVTQIDPAGAALLRDLIARLDGEGRHLRLASVGDGLASGLPQPFPDLDRALEWAEDAVLTSARVPQVAAELPLAAMELAAGLTPDQQEQLAAILERREYAAGTVILCEGDPADALFFLARGTVNVFITAAGDQARRLSSLPAGKAFGEMALLDGGRRSASVAAESDVVVFALPLGRLMMLAQPEIRLALILNLARNLSHRLRQANAEIASLA